VTNLPVIIGFSEDATADADFSSLANASKITTFQHHLATFLLFHGVQERPKECHLLVVLAM